ncbi:MAG: family 1 glycosylhydrolase [Acidimicrobiales bacterium]
MEIGALLTATELEGCAPTADWSRWIGRGRAPSSQRADGADGAGFGRSWPDDLEQLATLGVGAIGLTLEWARLEPRPGHHDEDDVELRIDMLRRARQLGLTVWACLVDGTLPGWFADDEGGFSDDRARTLLWPRHVDWIGERFGDHVDGWIPQREGPHWALRRHLLGDAPPGEADLRRAAEAVRAAVLADGEAWRLLTGTAPVATYQTARPVVAAPDDVKAAPLASGLERLLWHPWLTAITDGQLVVGDLPARSVEHLRGAFDRVVVELRPGITVDGQGRWSPYPGDGPVGPTGWVAWPEAQGDALHGVIDHLGDKQIVAAGSLADVTDDGRARPDHLRAMLDVAADAGIVGWWQTSPIDGYHWERGFGLRPGIIGGDGTETAAAATLAAATGT